MFGDRDLAKRKLLPGLFHLATSDLLPEQYRIIGTAPGACADRTSSSGPSGAVQQFGQALPTGAA
jgi:glucose-6-phosphate 1-dehydrogenase